MHALGSPRLMALCAALPLLAGCPGDDTVDTAADTTGTETDVYDGHDEDAHITDTHDGTGTTTTGQEGSTSGTTGDGSTGGSGSSGAMASSSSGSAIQDTWENWAHPEFITTYCAACHPSAESARDFNDYDTVVANEEHIYCGVAPEPIGDCAAHGIEAGHLPIGDGPKPSTEERWRFVDWIEAGMPRDR